MSAKDLFLEEREQDAHNVPPQEQEEQKSEYVQLIERLRNKEERLSYSSLKAFSESPREFINYKLKLRTPKNEGQVLGTLCDCMLTTPDELETKIAIVEKMPSTDMQKNFCNDVISGLSIEEAHKNNYKSGTPEKAYAPLKEYIDAVLSGKDMATPQLKEQAEKIVENLKKSDLVMQYVNSCHSFQNKLEWKQNGWDFLGFTDAEGDGLIIDFKYAGKGSDPNKFEREIINMKYYLQAALYTQALEYDGIPNFYFIVYDKSLNFSVIKLDYALVQYGIREYKYLLAKLEECIKGNRWGESYNFFDHSSSVRTVYKPGWLKGFDTETELI